MKTLKTKLFLFFLLLSLLPVFSSAKAFPKDLVVAQQADPKTLDPAATIDVYSHNINLSIYDRLFDWSSEMKAEPSLAERYEQKDPTTLYIKLREGVKFHNGDELTAEDVKFSLERAAKAPASMTFFASIEKVDILSKYEVNIITKTPYGPLISSLAHACGSILSKKYVESGNPNIFFEPVGTGPFKFDSWKVSDRIILTANKDYFGGAPYVERLVFRNIPEGVSRAIALETGEIDMVLAVDITDRGRIEENPHLVLHSTPSLGLNFIGLNCEKGPTSDVRVRQAIQMTINSTDIADAAYNKRAMPTYTVIPPGVLGYEKLPPYELSVEKAKKLLADAGYPNGLKLRFWTNENQSRKDTAVILQEQLRAIGIELSIEILEWSAYIEKISKVEQDLYMLGWPGATDPDGCLYPMFHSSNKGSAGNMSFYDNKKVDELLDKGRTSVDPAERESAYREAAKIIREEVGVYALVIPNVAVGAQDYLEGFFAYPTFMHLFKNVKKNLK
ncbi:MAG: ABC transporter substrate-binding protein [Fusobacteriaceae bacterium]|jgi:peptide/nickel transport system substrate-binding protein|nr:ABC transporter substrate-binding protein [Fusobacteriaceae bacterium]